MGNVRNHRTGQKCCAYWIITAITIQVQTIDRLGVQVVSSIGADKSAPLGRVIPSIAVIQAGIVIVVVTTVTDRVGIGNSGVCGFTGDRAVTPGIV